MAATLHSVPPPAIAALRPAILAHMRELGEHATSAFDSLFDSHLQNVLRGCLQRVGAHEGTAWLIDDSGEFLVPRFNTGAKSADFVGSFRQSLKSGMISMVVATELPICENNVCGDGRQDPTLDRKLGLETCAMLAVPFYFAGALRGIISGVQVREAGMNVPMPKGFSRDDLEALQCCAHVLSRLVEHRLLLATLGMEDLF